MLCPTEPISNLERKTYNVSSSVFKLEKSHTQSFVNILVHDKDVYRLSVHGLKVGV